MPTSAPGNRRRRGFERPRRRAGAVHLARGFTLVELLVVVALVAIGAGAVSLALRDRAGSRLDEEAARLVALLEGARAEARAAGLTVRWVPALAGDAPGLAGGADADFRFVGLPPALALPTRWLERHTHAEVLGAAALLLGPDAIVPAQRVRLTLGERQLEVGTDGLAPFAVRAAGDARR